MSWTFEGGDEENERVFECGAQRGSIGARRRRPRRRGGTIGRRSQRSAGEREAENPRNQVATGRHGVRSLHEDARQFRMLPFHRLLAISFHEPTNKNLFII